MMWKELADTPKFVYKRKPQTAQTVQFYQKSKFFYAKFVTNFIQESVAILTYIFFKDHLKTLFTQ